MVSGGLRGRGGQASKDASAADGLMEGGCDFNQAQV